MFDSGKPKNDDKIKGRPRSRLFMALMMFVIVVSGITFWTLLHPAPVFRPEFPATPLLYALDQHYETINLQTGERTKAQRPRFDAPPDSPADILAAQALINVMGERDRVPLIPSPDNQWLVGWKNTANSSRWDLMLYDRYDMGRSRSLVFFYDEWYKQLSWSADSQWITFNAHSVPGEVVDAEIVDAGDQEIWLVKVPVGKPKRLTSNTVTDLDPDFSPDGTQIVYSSLIDGDSHVGLYIMDLATGKSRIVKHDLYAHKPSWSPDGQWIASIAFDPHSGNRGLWIIRPDGTDAQSVVISEKWDEDVEWSP